MARRPKVINPFYLLLGVVGAVFAISALVYGVMTVQFFHATGDWRGAQPSHPLVLFFQEYGNAILSVELVLLGILTVAAIWTDDFWEQRAIRRSARNS